MLILGISSSHNATACLLKDGKIIACVSEERLNRIKNYWGMPYLAIKECLDINGLKIEDIDYLVLNFLDPKVHAKFSSLETEKKSTQTKKILASLWYIKEELLTKFPKSRYFYEKGVSLYYHYFVDPKQDKYFKQEIESKIGLPQSKILKMDHHTSHGFSAYYSSTLPKNEPTLIFTLDSSGDGICSTVSIGRGNSIKGIAKTTAGTSISDIYQYTTTYLGMKAVEHEHKVMGLAAYSDKSRYQHIVEKLKRLVWINSDLTFGTKIYSQVFYKVLPKIYANERFDNIAGAVQTLTEELVCEWIRKTIKKTGINNIVCAGGTFMNVKVNQRIQEMQEVKSLFVMPSAADESTAIGAAYWGYNLNKDQNTETPPIQPLTHLYLGREFNDDIQRVLNKIKNRKYTITKPINLEKTVASLLAKGEVVARFYGPSEWGARALGNRSILAHPNKLEVLTKINKQIKSRDFWMPFAPSIIEEGQDKYFVNNKNIPAPYMILAFDSTKEGQDKLKAACHQYDNTLRPQIVYKDWNPRYYKLIQEFKKQTGIGSLLNTSFNLHGHPIVYSPEDALFVFENSGLKYLALGSYLVQK